MLREITERVSLPRAAVVDLPLGLPSDVALQTQVIMAALAILQESAPGAGAVMRDFRANG